jgi:hypothetical protein
VVYDDCEFIKVCLLVHSSSQYSNEVHKIIKGLNSNEPLGAEAPPLVGGGGPRRRGSSSERQQGYADVKLRPNSIMICSITGRKEKRKKKKET